MDAQKRIDKILGTVHERVQEEIGALLGKEFKLSSPHQQLTWKEQFFDSLQGKQVFAAVDLSGDLEGIGGLIVTLKDAIRLGGTLIMLPQAELEEVAGREEYSEDLADSYGEIANIIAGSYTKVFEEMHPKKFRFIRKDHNVLQPVKVEIESEEPLPDQPYYQVGCAMNLDGVEMGTLYMLLPAKLFGLAEEDVYAPEDAGPEQPGEDVAAEQESESGTGPQEPGDLKSKPVNPAKQKKLIDKIFAGCQEKFSEEVSALTGSKINFSEVESSFVSKEDFFFDEVDGKQVMADIEVVGDRPGAGYLFFGLKSAIHVGGVLIMLPPSELENSVNEEDFTDDLQDSYGEIANIITGACSLALEEQYPGKIRVIRKDIQQVVPMKVDTGSDEPVPDQPYYMISMAVAADEKELGRLRFLFPVSVFQLEEQTDQGGEPATAPASQAEQVQAGQQDLSTALTGEVQEDSPLSKIDPGFDLAKHHKKVDKLLDECCRKVQSEVSELLGAEIVFDGLENRLVSKENFFFDEANGKQVVANLDVVGETEGKSYLFLSLKDAIHAGGVLIMLPAAELDKSISEEEFNEDTNDAYGEIANIIAGVYTAVFEEQYTKSLRFIKTDLAQVVPMKVETESDEPIPDQMYYMSRMFLSIDGEQKGKMNMLFPAELLQLEMLGREDELAALQTAQATEAGKPAAKAVHAESADSGGETGTAFNPADILVISDDESVAGLLMAGAQQKGLAVRTISFKDDIRSALTAEVKAVYLVMREVNEQAFGIAINVRATSTLPLVAAGPEWTRSKVIKAVKYGINDILLTPPSSEDVQESIDRNLVRMAA